jgi:tetratricopeptide (TPR) repeat protein
LAEFLGRPDEAVKSYADALRLPDHELGSEARRFAVQAALALLEGRHAEAETAASSYLALAPDRAGYFRRSVARLAQGKVEEALADAEAALRLSAPGADWILAQRARVLLAKGELRLAGEDVCEALRHTPRSPAVREVLAELCRREGALDQARAVAASIEAAGLGFPRYLACAEPTRAASEAAGPGLRRAESAARRMAEGDAEGAIAEATVAIGFAPVLASARRVRAEAWAALGREREAAADRAVADVLTGLSEETGN